MRAPATAWALWEQWAGIERQRTEVLAEIKRRAGAIPPAGVMWGRITYRCASALQAAPPPAWALLDDAAMERHRATVTRLLRDLEADQRRVQQARSACGLPEMEALAQRLAEEAQRIAGAIRRAPLTGPADMLARLDLITAEWDRTGGIKDPGKPLAELLSLMEALARNRPDFVPSWNQRTAHK
ncbi:hypothetical protein [Azospirillum sp. SYSU D00513]|uniref:hypothetical protein n=1 Tax=Azospirillum sp. SYSU D00513 TaxID=2812561 RepID=UPI001A97B2F0|nr:hypothetical protein [Azospirillum sp. SYSU D00513]